MLENKPQKPYYSNANIRFNFDQNKDKKLKLDNKYSKTENGNDMKPEDISVFMKENATICTECGMIDPKADMGIIVPPASSGTMTFA